MSESRCHPNCIICNPVRPTEPPASEPPANRLDRERALRLNDKMIQILGAPEGQRPKLLAEVLLSEMGKIREQSYDEILAALGDASEELGLNCGLAWNSKDHEKSAKQYLQRVAASSHTELRARLEKLAKEWRDTVASVTLPDTGLLAGARPIWAKHIEDCAAALEAALGEPRK